MKQEPEEQFFEKAKTVAKQIDNGTYSKELSDEEIEQVWKQAMDDWTKVDDGTAKLSNQPFVFFAKSILRKAQEK